MSLEQLILMFLAFMGGILCSFAAYLTVTVSRRTREKRLVDFTTLESNGYQPKPYSMGIIPQVYSSNGFVLICRHCKCTAVIHEDGLYKCIVCRKPLASTKPPGDE